MSYAIILGNLLVPLIEKFTMPVALAERQVQNVKNKNDIQAMLKEAGILFAITLIAGLLLGFVYELTRSPSVSRRKKRCRKPVRRSLRMRSILKNWMLIHLLRIRQQKLADTGNHHRYRL